MRIQLACKLAAVLIASAALWPDAGHAKPKNNGMHGCTAKQLQSVSEAQCPADLGHHIECSAGGTISCCNDEVDKYGLPVGFCIDLNKAVQRPHKFDLKKPLLKTQ
jgi:hypothetical protein